MSNPRLITTDAAAITAAPDQHLVFVDLVGTEAFILNLPVIDPMFIGRGFRLNASLTNGATLTIQQNASNIIVTNTGQIRAGTPLILDPPATFEWVYEVTTVISSGVGAWVFNSHIPGQLSGEPNEGDNNEPVAVEIETPIGRTSSVASAVGRASGKIQIGTGNGGDYSGSNLAEIAGASGNIEIWTGNGGVTVTNGIGGVGGDLGVFCGSGGEGHNGGGGGGGISVVGGTGASDALGGAPGSGGSVTVDTGVGGAADLTAAAGGGGPFTVTLGAGGAGTTGSNGGLGGGFSLTTGPGGNATGGGDGGDSGDLSIDVGAPGTGNSSGSPGFLGIGTTNAEDIKIGQTAVGRVNIPRLSEFDAQNSITATPATLRQYDLNVLTGINALYTLTLPLLTGEPSQDGMACRVIFGVAGTGVGTITIAAAGADNLLVPAITAIVPQVGTAFVFRAYGSTWFLESRSY